MDTHVVDYVEEIAQADLHLKQENVSQRIFVYYQGQVEAAVRDKVEKTRTDCTLCRMVLKPILFTLTSLLGLDFLYLACIKICGF